jgi:hypothetical protein
MPFCCRSFGCHVPHPKTTQVATHRLGLDNRPIPRAIIRHGAFDCEFARIAIDDDQQELPP